MSFRPGIVSDARSRGHRVCTANVRGMHNNVPRRRRVSRPPAHPRRRCSPVSRESNGRPLVKMLLFAYAAQRASWHPREGLDLLLSSPLRSTPMARSCEEGTRKDCCGTYASTRRLKETIVLLVYHCFT